MRDNNCKSRLLRHTDSINRFGQCPDLIRFDENRGRRFFAYPPLKTFHVGNEEIIADDYGSSLQRRNRRLPRRPIIFRKRIFDGHQRIAYLPILVASQQIRNRVLLSALRLKTINLLFRVIKFTRGHVRC